MDPKKQAALEADGWRFGTAGEFLDSITVPDADFLELCRQHLAAAPPNETVEEWATRLAQDMAQFTD